MTDERARVVKAIISEDETYGPGPGLGGDRRLLIDEVRRLQILLKDAHGYIVSESFCSCDDSPSVPCQVAQALEGA